jgi:hypothetical protein
MKRNAGIKQVMTNYRVKLRIYGVAWRASEHN